MAVYLVDNFKGCTDAFVVWGAGLGLQGLELSAAGVDGVFNCNNSWSRCNSFNDRYNSFNDRCNCFYN